MEPDYSWMSLMTDSHGPDKTPAVRWTGKYLLVEVDYGTGQIFIPRHLAQEFLRRVQAAVAEGFPREAQAMEMMERHVEELAGSVEAAGERSAA